MNKLLKTFFVFMLALGALAIAPTALAGSENDSEDDVSSEVDQAGASNSGDAVGGQVVGVVSAGDASVDATNRSEDVDVETGDATGENDLEQQVGQTNDGGENESEAEISSEVAQDASASSGDGVGGSVIGVVTAAGGSADVVAANTSEDTDIETGDGTAFNFLDSIVGQENGGGSENDSEDDISFDASQAVAASSGDGVGGQVLGIVSAGDASVDATNSTTDSDVETGDAYAENDGEYFVGQFTEGGGDNFSDGEIESELAQDASSNSGDAVAGQVAGVVTSAGGSADLVLANTSDDVDAESGDSNFVNEAVEFVGQEIPGDDIVDEPGDVTICHRSSGPNQQEITLNLSPAAAAAHLEQHDGPPGAGPDSAGPC